MHLYLQTYIIQLVLQQEAHDLCRLYGSENRAEIDMAALCQVIGPDDLQRPFQVLPAAGYEFHCILFSETLHVFKKHPGFVSAGGKLVNHGKDGTGAFEASMETAPLVLDLHPKASSRSSRISSFASFCRRGSPPVRVTFRIPEMQGKSRQVLGLLSPKGQAGFIGPHGITVAAPEIAAPKADKESRLSCPAPFSVDADECFRYLHLLLLIGRAVGRGLIDLDPAD